jgi:hypothetical protein
MYIRDSIVICPVPSPPLPEPAPYSAFIYNMLLVNYVMLRRQILSTRICQVKYVTCCVEIELEWAVYRHPSVIVGINLDRQQAEIHLYT